MSTASDTFALHGVRCAGCVLKIERRLAELPGVELARGNATQKRLRLVWDEGAQTLDTLKQSIRDLGYDATQIRDDQSASSEPSLLPRLAVAAFGMMNIMAFSLSSWFGQATDMGPGTMQFLHWLSAGLALPVMLYSGAVFHRPALRALRAGNMSMDAPITLAIWITFAGSLFETVRGSEDVYFDAVVSLIFFLLIGRVLEQAIRRRSVNAADNLRALVNVTADRIAHDGALTSVPASELAVGDRIMVQSGKRVPADGTLLSERAEFDESALTGEAMPRSVTKGEAVSAGTIVTQGPAELAVSHVGADSQVGQMAELVEAAAHHKGRLQLLSDRFAQGYIPLVLMGSVFGFALWYFVLGATFADALKIAVAVLIVTCPCAAGLATPAVTSRAINLALRSGIVIKSGKALEILGDVDRVFLDKTGTASLPQLRPAVSLHMGVLAEARELAACSKHPLARSLLDGFAATPETGVVEHPGEGVEAPSGARLGNAGFAGYKGAPLAQCALFFRDASGEVSPIPFDEYPRPDLDVFLSEITGRGLQVSLLSGDTPEAVGSFASKTGIDSWFAGVRPIDKLELIADAQKGGAQVLMVGDGINDSVALSGADVSASFAGATDIAQASADIVLTRPELRLLPQAIDLARSARRLVAQNLGFSTLYNVLTVPLALAGFLTPVVAALLMSSSSILVLANGFRLRSPE